MAMLQYWLFPRLNEVPHCEFQMQSFLNKNFLNNWIGHQVLVTWHILAVAYGYWI